MHCDDFNETNRSDDMVALQEEFKSVKNHVLCSLREMGSVEEFPSCIASVETFLGLAQLHFTRGLGSSLLFSEDRSLVSPAQQQ